MSEVKIARSIPHGVGLFLMVGAVVLWIHRPGEDTFVQPKFALWLALLGVLMATTALGALRGRAFRLGVTPTMIALLGLMLWAELSPAWASSDLLPRRALPAWWAILFTALLAQHVALTAPRGALRWIPSAFVGLVAFAALLTVAQDFRWIDMGFAQRLADWRGRIPGFLGNTTHTADLYAFGIAVSLFCLFFTRQRLAITGQLIAMLVITAAMIVSFSFHSDLSLIIGALFIAVAIGKRHWRLAFKRRGRLALLLLIWGGLLIFYCTGFPGNPHAPSILQEASGSDRLAWGWGSRLAIWSNSLAAIAARPWFGWGIGDFTHAFPQQFSTWVLTSNDPNILNTAGSWTNAAHNVFLHTWVELGIVGLGLLVAVLICHFRACLRLMRHPRRTLRLAGIWFFGLTLMWLVQGQMNFPLQMPVGRMLFAILLGAAAGLEAASRPPDAQPQITLVTDMRGWRFATLTLLIALLAAQPIYACWMKHEVLTMRRISYEIKKSFNEQRDAARMQDMPAISLALFFQENAEQWRIFPQAPEVNLWEGLDTLDEILKRDPGDTDARSTLFNMQWRIGIDLVEGASFMPATEPQRERLLQQGTAFLHAAVETGHEVLRGLSEAAVHEALAQVHDALGEPDIARDHLLRFYSMRPILWNSPELIQHLQRDPELRRRWESNETGF